MTFTRLSFVKVSLVSFDEHHRVGWVNSAKEQQEPFRSSPLLLVLSQSNKVVLFLRRLRCFNARQYNLNSSGLAMRGKKRGRRRIKRAIDAGDFVPNTAPEEGSQVPMLRHGTLGLSRTLYIVGRSMGPDAAGYTSSYTPNDPTHPLDPRKIFFLHPFAPILRSKRSAIASTSEDLIWPTTFLLPSILSFFLSSIRSCPSSTRVSRFLSDGLSYPLLSPSAKN